MKLVIDHMRGTRAGQRQVLSLEEKLTFGRHPQNHVVFDARGDLDASSRHAELVLQGEGGTLRDVGSSNGTWIDGQRVEELAIRLEEPVEVEFGKQGPVLRLWLGGEGSEEPELPPRRGRGGGRLSRLMRRFLRGQ